MPGCITEYYYPTTQNVAVLKDKGDIYLAGAFNGDCNAVAAGYAFTDHIGLIGNFAAFDNPQDTARSKYQGYYWEPELALFTRWKGDSKWRSNMFSSLHFAYAHGQLARNQDYYTMGVSRYSMQPGVGFSNRFFDVALSARIAIVDHKFTQLKTFDLKPGTSLRSYYELHDVGDQAFGFFEPALTIGLGYKYVKLRLQFVNLFPIGDGQLNYVSSTAYLSANIMLNPRDFKNNTQK